MEDRKLDPVLLLLLGGIVFFTCSVFVAEYLFKDDGQIFQVMSNLLSGFGGALLMRVKPRAAGDPSDPPIGTTKQVTSTTKTTVQEPARETPNV